MGTVDHGADLMQIQARPAMINRDLEQQEGTLKTHKSAILVKYVRGHRPWHGLWPLT